MRHGEDCDRQLYRLPEGVHAIRVSNGSAWAPDIDRMTL